MSRNPNFCDHLLYLARYDYENYVPVYESEYFLNEQRVTGDDQIFFNFCPLCGSKLGVIDNEDAST